MTDQIVFIVGSPAPSSVSTVANIGAEIDAIAANIANVTAVGDDLRGEDAIGAVANDLNGAASVPAVAAIATDVSTVAGVSPAVQQVADIDAEVEAVAAIANDITDVANNVASQADLNLGWGQSNYASSNSQAAGGDLTTDELVKIWNHNTSAFETWNMANGFYAYTGGSLEQNKNNILFQMAKLRRKLTGRTQYCVLVAKGGQSITEFVPATAALYADIQSTMTEVLASTEMQAFGKTQIDTLTGFQGEADSGLDNYSDQVDALITQFNAETWMPAALPLVGYELAQQFVQSEYWTQAPLNDNGQVTSVKTADLDFGVDGVHITGADMDVAGARAAYLTLGGMGVSPPDANILKPRATQTSITYIVGTGQRFATVSDCLNFLSSKTLQDADKVTIRLAEGAHAAFDTSNFTGSFPIEIRGYDGAATSFPASGDLSGGSAAAVTEIKAQWASWVDCASGDSQGVKLVGDNITLRGLAILANGESINVGLDVYGKAEVYSCAVHGFAQDQVIIRNGANVDISEVACYGGFRGLTLYGRAYSENYATRDNVFVAQTTYAVSLDDAAICGSMCGNDVAEFTGSWTINATRSCQGFFNHLTTDTVKALIRVSDGADLFVDDIVCAGISVGASPSNTPETFRLSGDAKLTIGDNFTIPTHNSRFCYNAGGRFRVNGNAIVSAWTGTSIEFMRSQYPDSVINIVGTLEITADTDGGTNDIRCDDGGQILTRFLSLPSGTSITNNPAVNSLQSDGRFISETG